MVERRAVSNGLASAPATWDGGTLPAVGDDVYANNFTVTIDVNATWFSARTTAGATAVAGGGFVINDGVTLRANVIAGSTPALTYNGLDAITVVGNVTGGAVSGAHGVLVSSDGTVTVVGNVIGGTDANARGIYNAAGGRIVVQGDAISVIGQGAVNALNGTIAVAGNAVGGDTNAAYGVFDQTTSTGQVSVLGYAIGSATGFGPGICGFGLKPVFIYRAISGANGCYPVLGNVVFYNPGAVTFEIRDSAFVAKVLKMASANIKGFPLSRLVQ